MKTTLKDKKELISSVNIKHKLMEESEEIINIFSRIQTKKIEKQKTENRLLASFIDSLIKSYEEDIQRLINRKARWEFYQEMQKAKTIADIPTNKLSLTIEEIKQYPITDYLEAVGIPVSIQTTKHKKYLCPIHNEKTPSFVVDKGKNLFYCFGCNKGGSIIDLVMELEDINTKEAINIIKKWIY